MGNLIENDFQRVADLLGVEVAVVKAIQAVETGGRGGFVYTYALQTQFYDGFGKRHKFGDHLTLLF